MARGGFESIIGQDAAVAAFRAAFERARLYGRADGALILGRKGGGKTAFIKAAAADSELPARYADCAALNRAGLLEELAYSGVDRRGGFQQSFFGEDAPDLIVGDRVLALDNLGALNKRGRDALALLMRESKIRLGRMAYQLPFRVWIAAAADAAEPLDKGVIDLFSDAPTLAPYAPGDLMEIALGFARGEFGRTYAPEALAMAICPPRDTPGDAAALLREVDRDLDERGAGGLVDGSLMREALGRQERTPCGLLVAEYRYLAALAGMGGYGSAGAIAKRLGVNSGLMLADFEARMEWLGLIGRSRRVREITPLGEERLEAARDSERLIV